MCAYFLLVLIFECLFCVARCFGSFVFACSEAMTRPARIMMCFLYIGVGGCKYPPTQIRVRTREPYKFGCFNALCPFWAHRTQTSRTWWCSSLCLRKRFLLFFFVNIFVFLTAFFYLVLFTIRMQIVKTWVIDPLGLRNVQVVVAGELPQR